mmetsp:Transcript_14875/g.41200  ORF Transcript_14875/g.41200 Transcript_14875/m.41200 type:complete len:240 (-) Transcript_14875:22-741(-)
MADGTGLASQSTAVHMRRHIELAARTRCGQRLQQMLTIAVSVEVIHDVLAVDRHDAEAGLDPNARGGRLAPTSAVRPSALIDDGNAHRGLGVLQPALLLGIQLLLEAQGLLRQLHVLAVVHGIVLGFELIELTARIAVIGRVQWHGVLAQLHGAWFGLAQGGRAQEAAGEVSLLLRLQVSMGGWYGGARSRTGSCDQRSRDANATLFGAPTDHSDRIPQTHGCGYRSELLLACVAAAVS